VKWLLLLLGDTPSDLAIIKYFGQHMVGAPHALCKNAECAPYVKTPVETMEQIASMTKQHQSVKAVYNHLTSALDIDTAQRNAAWSTV